MREEQNYFVPQSTFLVNATHCTLPLLQMNYYKLEGQLQLPLQLLFGKEHFSDHPISYQKQKFKYKTGNTLAVTFKVTFKFQKYQMAQKYLETLRNSSSDILRRMQSHHSSVGMYSK